MRAACLLVLAASVLQGCTLLGAGVAADLNRQRRADATTAGDSLARRPPTPGDFLTLRLTTGERVRGPFLTVSLDSLVLLGAGSYALHDVVRVERPWRRADVRTAVAVGFLVDAAVVWYALRSIRLTGLDGFGR